MKITYHKDINILTLDVRDGRVARTVEHTADEIYLDLDHNGFVLSVEVLDAAGFLRRLEESGEPIAFPDRIEPDDASSLDMTAPITLSQAAELAGLTPIALRKAAQRGTLQAERIGPTHRGIWHTTRADLEAYLDNRPAWFQSGSGQKAGPDSSCG